MQRNQSIIHFAVQHFLKNSPSNYTRLSVERSILVTNNDVGNEAVCYIAARVSITGERPNQTYAAVVPITMSANEIILRLPKIYYEWQHPPYFNCPPYILEALSPTICPNAIFWRNKCARQPWNYHLAVSSNANGTRNIAVLLSQNKEASILHAEIDVQNQDFEEVFDKLSVRYAMTGIRAERAGRS